jgi:hypothetical protein
MTKCPCNYFEEFGQGALGGNQKSYLECGTWNAEYLNAGTEQKIGRGIEKIK